MAIKKVSITLPEEQWASIRRQVKSGKDETISRFVQRAVQKALEASTEFETMVDQMLMETGGPMTAKERAWARKWLTPVKRKAKNAKPRKAA